MEIVERLAKDIFTKYRYPHWVRATRRIERKNAVLNDEVGVLHVRITNYERWLEYTLRVQTGMSLKMGVPDYSIWIVAELGKTFDLFLPRSKTAVEKIEYTCLSGKDFAYYFNREFRKTLLYCQALVQMKWTDINLFQLLRYELGKLLRVLGMD
jgi:hypothetical protein